MDTCGKLHVPGILALLAVLSPSAETILQDWWVLIPFMILWYTPYVHDFHGTLISCLLTSLGKGCYETEFVTARVDQVSHTEADIFREQMTKGIHHASYSYIVVILHQSANSLCYSLQFQN